MSAVAWGALVGLLAAVVTIAAALRGYAVWCHGPPVLRDSPFGWRWRLRYWRELSYRGKWVRDFLRHVDYAPSWCWLDRSYPVGRRCWLWPVPNGVAWGRDAQLYASVPLWMFAALWMFRERYRWTLEAWALRAGWLVGPEGATFDAFRWVFVPGVNRRFIRDERIAAYERVTRAQELADRRGYARGRQDGYVEGSRRGRELVFEALENMLLAPNCPHGKIRIVCTECTPMAGATP